MGKKRKNKHKQTTTTKHFNENIRNRNIRTREQCCFEELLPFFYLFILVKKILELIVISDNSAISSAEVSHVVLIKMWASHHQVSHRSDV